MFLKDMLKKNIVKSIYYNKLCRQVIRSEQGELNAGYGSVFIIDKHAKLKLYHQLYTNHNCFKRNGRSTILRLDKDSCMDVKGKFYIYYDGDIICFKDSRLELGSGFFNSNIKIRCSKQIKIGQNVAISHDVTIMDSDAHSVGYNGYRKAKPVVIGDSVWIGSRSIILKGVQIGDHSIVGAGSVVTKDIPPYCLAVGNPARVIKTNITWEN